jgi:hypothetical protein
LKGDKTWIFCLVLGMVLVMPSCGKKGPPFLPKKSFDVRVRDLRGEGKEGSAFLKGQVVGGEEKDRVQGARVDYAQYPVDEPPCDGCPIEFRGSYDFGPEVITETGFDCEVPVDLRGQLYFFRVYLIGPDDGLGPVSNTVRVVVD